MIFLLSFLLLLFPSSCTTSGKYLSSSVKPLSFSALLYILIDLLNIAHWTMFLIYAWQLISAAVLKYLEDGSSLDGAIIGLLIRFVYIFVKVESHA